jgi:anti-sigma regulatory factor (Ser/Thr protein kinase)
MASVSHASVHDGFRHEALFYSNREEFLERTGAFIEDGVTKGEPTLVVLSADKIAALRSKLAGRAEGVHFADMAQVGSNPARIIPAWRAFVSENSPRGGRLRGIGEPIWAERDAAELVECQRHEALLNLAFADAAGFHLLCPYDTNALEPGVLDEARRSHPFVATNGHEGPSLEYRALEDVAAPFAEPLPEPTRELDWRVFQDCSLSALRDFVAAHAAAAGLGVAAIEDFVLAVHEISSNSVVHGGGGGILRIWQEDDTLVCEVQDRGLIENPLVGRERPKRGQFGGQGLWLANQMCDLVQIRTFEDGSVVRLHKRRS